MKLCNDNSVLKENEQVKIELRAHIVKCSFYLYSSLLISDYLTLLVKLNHLI